MGKSNIAEKSTNVAELVEVIVFAKFFLIGFIF